MFVILADVLQLLIEPNATTEIFASVDDEIKLRDISKRSFASDARSGGNDSRLMDMYRRY